MSKRRETTKALSDSLEKHINPYNDTRIYMAREVTFDYSTDHAIRVDYMRFKPVNNTVSGIEKGDFFLSWPSGHSANVFMAFGFLLTWFTVRYADSKLKKPVLTFTFAVCVTTMILRMLSGNHFMTDVLSGAAIGCVSGYFISALCYRINGEKK